MTEKWTFNNDYLFGLVATNQKHGTCCLYNNDNDLARVGDTNIIYNSHGDEIMIKITSVRKCRFCDIDEQWAKIEGEGDLSLQHWIRVHMDFFKKEKSNFKPTDMLELNEFIVINQRG